jgi:myo-inositol-1(or 4)-monophosphatase
MLKNRKLLTPRTMDTKKYLDFAVRLSKKAGKIALKHYGTAYRVDYKGGVKNNLVTEVDHMIEKMALEEIHKKFPTHCVLSEECGDSGDKSSDCRWIIDPIDGTTNYAHGYSFFAVSIGFEIKGELIAGVVNAPYLKELFSAGKGLGAHLNGKPISVSKTADLETSLLATGFTYKNRGLNLPNFEYFLYNSQGIRRCGSATLDLCSVACGRLDGYWEFGLKPWDMAAGALIVREAGGLVTAMDGTPLKLEGKSMIAANPAIHKHMCHFFRGQPQLQELIHEAKESASGL